MQWQLVAIRHLQDKQMCLDICWSCLDNNLGIAALPPKVAAHRQANRLL